MRRREGRALLIRAGTVTVALRIVPVEGLRDRQKERNQTVAANASMLV